MNELTGVLKDEFKRYAEEKIMPSGFILALLENDLKETISRADHINIHRLPDLVEYAYNNLPTTCWGSKQAVKEWIK